MITLFSGQTANSSSTIFKLDGDKSTRDSQDGERVIVPSGEFDGASISLKISANGVDFADMETNTSTSSLAELVYLPNELFVQATLTNAGASTSINYHIV